MNVSRLIWVDVAVETRVLEGKTSLFRMLKIMTLCTILNITVEYSQVIIYPKSSLYFPYKYRMTKIKF